MEQVRSSDVVLVEVIDTNYNPTEEDIEDYGRWIGMKFPEDEDLLWIAIAGLKEALPEEWKPCLTVDDDVYYYNFCTGESIWDHPCDEKYRKLYAEELAKKLQMKGEGQKKQDFSWTSSLLQEGFDEGGRPTRNYCLEQVCKPATERYSQGIAPENVMEKTDVFELGPSIQEDGFEDEIKGFEQRRSEMRARVQSQIMEEEALLLQTERQKMLDRSAKLVQEEEPRVLKLLYEDMVKRVENLIQIETLNLLYNKRQEAMKDLEKRLEAQKRELEAKNKSFEEKRNKVEQECNELHGGNEIYESPNKDKRSEEHKHMHTVSELIEKEKKNPDWESCFVIQSKCEEMQQKRATRMEQEKDILQRFKAKIEAEEEALYEKLKSEMILEMAKENFKHFEKNAFEEIYHSLLQSIQMEVELRKKEMLKQFEGELEVDSFRHKEASIKQRKIDVYERMCETIAKEEEIELQNARRKSRRQVKRKKND